MANDAGKRDVIRIVVVGLGNIGRRFLTVVETKGVDLQARYGIRFKLVGAADSKGAAINEKGLDVAAIE